MGQCTSRGFCSPSKVGGEGAGRGGVRQEETASGRTSIQEKTEQSLRGAARQDGCRLRDDEGESRLSGT